MCACTNVQRMYHAHTHMYARHVQVVVLDAVTAMPDFAWLQTQGVSLPDDPDHSEANAHTCMQVCTHMHTSMRARAQTGSNTAISIFPSFCPALSPSAQLPLESCSLLADHCQRGSADSKEEIADQLRRFVGEEEFNRLNATAGTRLLGSFWRLLCGSGKLVEGQFGAHGGKNETPSSLEVPMASNSITVELVGI